MRVYVRTSMLAFYHAASLVYMSFCLHQLCFVWIFFFCFFLFINLWFDVQMLAAVHVFLSLYSALVRVRDLLDELVSCLQRPLADDKFLLMCVCVCSC